MKKRHILLFSLLTCCMLSGCAESSAPNDTAPNSEPSAQNDSIPDAQGTAAQFEAPEWATDLPVIMIETVSRDPDILDFVTQPVAPHVSEQIATWTPNYKMPPAPYYEACQAAVYDPAEGSEPQPVDCEVKVRGNWTTTYEKKPLRLKFAEKQNLLGLNDGAEQKNWVLLAEYKDAAMVRDEAALQMSREILDKDSLYAADARLVEVQINGEYWGVYLLTEQQQVGSARVDITKPEQDYQGTDIGYYLEFDGYFYNEEPLQQFHVDYADNAPLTPYTGAEQTKKQCRPLPENNRDPKSDIGFTIKSEIYSQEQHDFIADYVSNVYRIMYAAAYEDKAYAFNADYSEIAETAEMTPQEAVEAVVNVQSLADMYIISEMTCDADIYWSSFYMTADFGAEGDKKLTFQAPWDFDSGLGNKNRCVDGKGFYAGSLVPDVNGTEYETVNPWLCVLMYEDWYQDVIRETWTSAYEDGVFSRAAETVRTETAAHPRAFLHNNQRWGISTKDQAIVSELSRAAKKCSSQEAAAEYLADWIEKRTAFLNENWHS